MRKFIIVGLLLVTYALFSQISESASSLEDSLSVIQEVDSLNSEIEIEIEDEPFTIDQLEIQLLEIIENRLKNRKDIDLPIIHTKENFHYSALMDPDFIIRKNGFTILPFKVKDLHLFQNLSPLFLTHRQNSVINFQQENYQMPIPITESFLALGDNNMNHAGVWFSKGNILNLKNLNLEAAYLGQEGDWLGVNESSRNFNFHIFRNFNWGEIHLNTTILDQRIPITKLISINDPEISSVKEKFSDSSVRFLNRYVNLGLRYEDWELANEKQITKSILLFKEFNFPNHTFDLSYEFLKQKSSEKSSINILTIQHYSTLLGSQLKNDLQYKDEDDYLINSDLFLRFIAGFGVNGVYENIRSSDVIGFNEIDRLGAGIAYRSNSISSSILFTEIQENLTYHRDNALYNDLNYSLIQFRNQMNIKLGMLSLSVNNYLDKRSTELKSGDQESLIPKWRSRTSFEVALDLRHHNSIGLGAVHNYYSDFLDITDDTSITEGNFLDLFLALHVSEFFMIKIDAINITSEKYFPYSVELDSVSRRYNYDTHINFTVNWIFVN